MDEIKKQCNIKTYSCGETDVSVQSKFQLNKSFAPRIYYRQTNIFSSPVAYYHDQRKSPRLLLPNLARKRTKVLNQSADTSNNLFNNKNVDQPHMPDSLLDNVNHDNSIHNDAGALSFESNDSLHNAKWNDFHSMPCLGKMVSHSVVSKDKRQHQPNKDNDVIKEKLQCHRFSGDLTIGQLDMDKLVPEDSFKSSIANTSLDLKQNDKNDLNVALESFSLNCNINSHLDQLKEAEFFQEVAKPQYPAGDFSTKLANPKQLSEKLFDNNKPKSVSWGASVNVPPKHLCFTDYSVSPKHLLPIDLSLSLDKTKKSHKKTYPTIDRKQSKATLSSTNKYCHDAVWNNGPKKSVASINLKIINQDLMNSGLWPYSITNKDAPLLETSHQLIQLREPKSVKGIHHEELLLKSRYFRRWLQNSRINRKIRQLEILKHKKAATHYQSRQLSQHFMAWRFRQLQNRFKAQELYRLHMLSKGFSGYKKKKEKDCCQALLGGEFVYKIKESCKLLQSNNLEQFYCTWKLKFEVHEVKMLAIRFHQFKLKQKALRNWILFTADRDVVNSQSALAHQKYKFITLKKLFIMWKKTSQIVGQVGKLQSKKILKKYFLAWTYSTKYLKMYHSNQNHTAMLNRQDNLLRSSLICWKRQLIFKIVIKKRNTNILRFSFLYWRHEFKVSATTNVFAFQYSNKLLMKHGFKNWKQFCETSYMRKNKAKKKIVKCQLLPYFNKWKQIATNKKCLAENLGLFLCAKSQKSVKVSWKRWKSKFYAEIVKKLKHQQWSDECVQRAFRKWVQFTKQKNLKNKKEELLVAGCFKIWVREFRNRQAANRQVKLVAGKICRNKRAIMFWAWYECTQHSKFMKPFIKKRERKLTSRIFDSWRRVFEKRHELKMLLHTHKLFILCKTFTIWKDKATVLKIIEDHKSKTYLLFLKTHFLSWKKYVDQRGTVRCFYQKHTKFYLKTLFHTWSIRAKQCRKEKVEKIEQEQKRRKTMVDCFQRWKEEVQYEKILLEDSLIWFAKGHDLDMKLATFKRWNWALIRHRIAAQFSSSKAKEDLRVVFNAWFKVTQESITQHTQQFNKQLQHKSKIGCEWSSDCSATSDSACLSRFLQSDLNDCNRSSSTLFNKNHSNHLKPATSRFLSLESNETAHSSHLILSDSGFGVAKDSSSEMSSVKDKFVPFTNNPRHLTFIAHHQDIDLQNFVQFEQTEDLTVSHENLPSSESDSSTSHYKLNDSKSSAGTLTIHDIADVSEFTTNLSHKFDDAQKQAFCIEKRKTFACSNQSSIFRDTFSENGSNLETSPLKNVSLAFNNLRKPGITNICIEESSEMRLERLAKFAIARLLHPSLSYAFYQWKLLIHTNNWLKFAELKSRQQCVTKTTTKYFNEWRRKCNSAMNSSQYHKSKLIRPAFLALLNWYQFKRRTNKMKRTAENFTGGRLLKTHFDQWRKLHRQKRELNEILAYWKSRVSDHNQLSQSGNELRQRRDSALVRSCFDMWRMRRAQLEKCDEHHSNVVMLRALRAWCYAKQQCVAKKGQITELRTTLVRRKHLKTWRRMLARKMTVDAMRFANKRSWMVDLLRRWKRNATEQRNRNMTLQRLCVNSRLVSLRTCFALWHHKCQLRSTADQSRDRTLLRKSIIAWRKCVMDKKFKRIHVQAAIYARRTRVVSTYFLNWKRQLALDKLMQEFRVKLLCHQFVKWRKQLQCKRARSMGEHSTLRRCFYLWVEANLASQKERAVARKIVAKWHDFTTKSRQLSLKVDCVVSSQSNLNKEIAFNQWLIASEQSQAAREHFRTQHLERVFAAWRLEVQHIGNEKRKVAYFLTTSEHILLQKSWKCWKFQLQRLRELNLDQLKLTHRFRKLRLHDSWLNWKRHADSKIAQRHFNLELTKKAFNSWRVLASKSLSTKNASKLFQVSSEKACLALHVLKWRSACNDARKAKSLSAQWQKFYAITRWKEHVARELEIRKQLRRITSVQNTSLITKYFAMWRQHCKYAELIELQARRCHETFQITAMKISWDIWKKKHQMEKARLLRVTLLEKRVFARWRHLMTRRRLNVHAEMFRRRTELRFSFISWRKQFKVQHFRRQRNCDITNTFWQSWKMKTAMSLHAPQYNRIVTLRKFWTSWRIAFVEQQAVVEVVDSLNVDLMRTMFSAWRSILPPKKTFSRPSSTVSSPRFSSKSRSRIPRPSPRKCKSLNSDRSEQN